jgi:glycosyltransferase involved in cell wall biosynthesis
VREAAAMHTPSILLRESTAATAITDGVNGFLTHNDPADFVQQIMYLMNRPDEIKSVGEKASKTISRSWESVIEEVALRYRDLQASYRFKQGK